MSDLVERLRKQARCVYLAVEDEPAADLSDGLGKAADRIEALQAALQHSVDDWRERGRRIEALEAAVNDARVLLLKNTSAMTRAADRIEALEAALRKISGKRLSTEHDEEGMDYESGYDLLVMIARAALALERGTK